MRRNALFFTLFAISLAFVSTAAFSQPHGRHQDREHDRHRGQHSRDQERHHYRHHDRRSDSRHDFGRSDLRRFPPHVVIHPPVKHGDYSRRDPRRMKPVKRFHKGRPIPHVYHHHHYVVHHWHDHHLHRPPRGHHWVRIDGDYLLVAIATGIIVDILVTR